MSDFRNIRESSEFSNQIAAIISFEYCWTESNWYGWWPNWIEQKYLW